MKAHKGHKKGTVNGTFDKSVRMEMATDMWKRLEAIAEAEGRVQGRPRSVSAVIRRVLGAFIEQQRGAK